MPVPKPRKVGNPNNQPVRGYRGVSAEALRAKRLAKKAPAGQADRVVSYDPAAVRAAIEAQTCPFCGRGPYKVLANHTRQAHGVDRRELRNLAGLLLKDSICSPETSRKSREHALRTRTVEAATQAARDSRKQRQWTEAGKRRRDAALAAGATKRKAAAAEENADLAREFNRLGGGPEAVEELADRYGVDRKSLRERLLRCGCQVPDARPLASQRRRQISDADRREMARLYGRGLSQSQIAARFGINQTHVSVIFRQDGVKARPFHRSSRNP